MLTAEEFTNLSIQDQVEILLGHATELLERIFIDNIVKLYMLNDFYVEIWYQQISNRIKKVEVVELNQVIHLYENTINISDLFK